MPTWRGQQSTLRLCRQPEAIIPAPRLWFSVLLWLLAVSAPQAAEIPLPTQLNVSGPPVFLKAPLGWAYRPGYPFPLQVRVHNAGAEFEGEISIIAPSGGASSRPGLYQRVSFPANSWRQFAFALQAAPIKANLELEVREFSAGSAVRPLLFKGSLAHLLQPLPAEARLIVSCGSGSALMPTGRHDHVTHLLAADLPDELWMYETVDLLVLQDATFSAASPPTRTVVKSWLNAGGRVLLTSPEALRSAIAAGLLPLQLQPHEIVGSDWPWWQAHAGLSRQDVLAWHANRPVYLRLNIGFGQVIVLVPGSPPDAARLHGLEVLKNLRRERERLPDLRLQPERYRAFVFGAINPALRTRALVWIALGALVLGIILALSFSSRSRWESAGWPLALGAVLLVLLTYWFPRAELSVTHVAHVRHSGDGRASLHEQWSLIEAFSQPGTIHAAAPEAGLATPLFAEHDELRRVEYNLAASGGKLHLQNLNVTPSTPVLLYSRAISSNPEAADNITALKSNRISLEVRGPGLPSRYGSQAILVRASEDFWVVSGLQDSAGFTLSPYDSAESLVRTQLGAQAAPEVIKARAAVLKWATAAAIAAGRDTLVLWELQPRMVPLASLTTTAKSLDEAACFAVYSFEVSVKEH